MSNYTIVGSAPDPGQAAAALPQQHDDTAGAGHHLAEFAKGLHAGRETSAAGKAIAGAVKRIL